MEDPVVPGRHGGRHAGDQQAGIPAMPVALPGAGVPDVPYPLLDGLNPTLGWRSRPPERGGPAFVIIRRAGLGRLRVTEIFPLTQDGWARAWHALATQNAAASDPKVLAKLHARNTGTARTVPGSGSPQLSELDACSLMSLRGVACLGGYVPETAIMTGELYDVRFLSDRLQVFASGQPQVLAEIPYGQVEDLEIGGPGLVRTGGGFIGGGFGARGAIEGMAIASVLNALTTRTSIKTVMRIQATGCELFLLHTGCVPDRLRIAMSRPLGAIRSARAAETSGRIERGSHTKPFSLVEELARLADMLDKGLLTRDEFDQMKARLLSGPTI